MSSEVLMRQQQHDDGRPVVRSANMSAQEVLGDVDMTDYTSVGTALAHVDGRSATVLVPDINLDRVAPHIVAIPRAYMFGGLDRARWCWQPDKNQPKWALLGSALNVLARAAGAQTTLTQVDEREAHVWSCTYGMKVMGPDGTWSEVQTTRFVDLRDGTAEAEAALGRTNNPAALARARTFGPQLAESKARNRAIRQALGIRGSFDADEINRPMLLITFAFSPAPGSALEREYNLMLARVASGLAVMPATTARPARVILDDGDDEEMDVIDAVDVPQPRQAPPRSPAPARQPPPARQEPPPRPPVSQQQRPAQQHEPDQEDDAPHCAECRAVISINVHDFSVKHFNRPLCMNHQPKRATAGDDRRSSNGGGRSGRNGWGGR